MRFRILVLPAAAFSLLILANHEAHAILGGTLVEANDPIAASTVLVTRDHEGDDSPLYCSGVLIDDDLVLTAAHCVRDRESRRIIFGRDVATPGNPVARVLAYAIPPDFKLGYANTDQVPKNNDDLAVYYFEGGVPHAYQKAAIVPAGWRPLATTFFTEAGYGLDTNPEQSGPWDWGVLRKGVFSIANPNYSKTEIEIAVTSSHHGRAGDSGGPLYVMDGETPMLAGLCNWGDDSTIEVFANVRKHWDWIQSAARKLRAHH